jgi:uncharacterized protein involved in exopolysaccharide biosynthesis
LVLFFKKEHPFFWSGAVDSLIDLRAGPAPPVLAPAAILRILRRSWLPICACAVLGAAAAYSIADRMPKSFTASGQIAVAGDQMAIPELQGALRADNAPDPMPQVHTEMQALVSRQLLQRVIEQLHIDRDPEFNGALRPPTLLGSLKNTLKSLLPHGNGPAAAGAAEDALLGAVDRALVISQDNRSLVIGISFTAQDPNLAAAFVNTLVTDYIATRADRRQTANQGANTVMSQRIEQVRRDINTIEQKMRALRTSSDMVGLRAGSVGQQQVEDLATAASRATLDRSQIEAQYERAAALASSGSSDALASVLGSETISRLREQEAEAAAKVADLSMRYGANWPALRSAEADLSSIRRQIAGESHRIVDSLATQLRVARAHEADVLAQLSAARHEGVAAENVQAELTQLQQDAATRRDLYRTLLERAEQTGAEPLRDEMPDIRVLSQAVPPGLPSAPNVKAATGLAGLAGGLLAGVLALAFTTRRGGLIDAETFARVEGLTTIATLPGKSALAGTGRAGLAARVLANPASEEAGAMRMARARLGQISRRAPRKIGFVGAQTGTAAASAAAAFGRVAALDGQRVLLVAADAAQPNIARVLGVVGDSAAAKADWRDGVMQDASGMEVLPGCATAQGGVALENLLAEANEEYDVIVLGAPAIAQQDALTLARSCDVTVLVIEARVGVNAALEARGRLSPMSRSPLAAILFAPR